MQERISVQSHMHFNSYNAGIMAEFRARWYLRFRGFWILESRYITGKKTGRAEIDIIARRGNLLIFAEVKNRPTIIGAVESVGHSQAVRLRRAAADYMRQKHWTGAARFDVIAVCGKKIYWSHGALNK
ncbi:MAG: YraN family protein [Rickettsiales bacterium]|jgi:putative endonuclease|nr:YraN family protein [Rickettsiales bacterium]